jgi:hypothetical protein
MTSGRPADEPAPGENTPATADVDHLVHRRGLTVPGQDREPLAEYWAHIRQLRDAVDEHLLADHEIALTWTAVDPDAG